MKENSGSQDVSNNGGGKDAAPTEMPDHTASDQRLRRNTVGNSTPSTSETSDSISKDQKSRQVSDVRPSTASGWMGWLGGRSTAPQETATDGEPPSEPTPLTTSASEPTPPESPEHVEPQPSVPTDTVQPDKTEAGTSWFGFWSTSQATEDVAKVTKDTVIQDLPKPSEDTVMEDAPKVATPMETTSAGSTWAFWSRDTRPKSTDKLDAVEESPGEFAAIGEGSESNPKLASGVEVREATPKPPSLKDAQTNEVAGKTDKSKKSKRTRPQSMEIKDQSAQRPQTPKSDTSKQPSTLKGEVQANLTPANLLLPSFKSTYHLKENPSIIRQIADLLQLTKQPPANHVYLAKEHPKISKALAIGVHGLYPAAYLRPMIGQPTGTSIKFANHCADALRRWADSHGSEDCEIEKVALEGEGKISERVDNLWKLLLNWIDHIRQADLIVVACHSQGVPVGIMLVAKLIELGIITTQRIGVCAMAGVSLGPFPDYKSGLLMGSAAELWEFAKSDSEISKRYEKSMKTVLDYGVRLTYVGSIDDQVVPMEVSFDIFFSQVQGGIITH